MGASLHTLRTSPDVDADPAEAARAVAAPACAVARVLLRRVAVVRRVALVAPAIGALAVLALAPAPAGAEIHRCPRADGTTEYRDRPCSAGPAAAPAPAPDATASDAPRRGRAVAARGEPGRTGASPTAAGVRVITPAVPATAARETPTASTPAERTTPPPSVPATRADYVARNDALCREGNRRACAAVTCDRSGDLGSPACQEAVGYVRGRGWDLRPASDPFDAARARDDYTLTCRATGRRAALSRRRGSDMFDWPDGAAASVPRAGLDRAARSFCGSP